MTYDVKTEQGQVRLLALDSFEQGAVFSDDEIQAFLNLNQGDVLLAAAQALDVQASSQALVLKRIVMLDLQTDGSVVSAQLAAHAEKLRQQYLSGLSNPAGTFDWAEMVLTSASARERLIELAKREDL